MTTEEYISGLKALEEKKKELSEEYIRNNPFKHLDGKIVYRVTKWGERTKVLFLGVGYNEDGQVRLLYQFFNRDGNTSKRIQSCLIDNKFYKFEEICKK